MKRVLHSGEFLDYDGNTIRVTFYNEKHLWVSPTQFTDLPKKGCSIDVDVWSDAGGGTFNTSNTSSWVKIETISKVGKNRYGYDVFRLRFTVSENKSSWTRTGNISITFSPNNLENKSEYDSTSLTKIITITQI